MSSNPLAPSVPTLVKLGSIARHVEEILAPGAHEFDVHAVKGLLKDPDIQQWMKAADAMALLPVKRSAGD